MIAYFDTSALVKLLVDEEGSEWAARLWDSCDSAVSSRLAYPEVCAALAAGVRSHRITDLAHERARSEWSSFASSMQWVELTSAVAIEAGRLAERHRLSGADATHLASGLALGEDHALFVTWDRRLWEATRNERLLVMPDVIG